MGFLIQGLAENTEVLEETDSLFLLWGHPPHQNWELPSVGSGSSPGEGNGNLLQYSCRENLMDRGAWQAVVHGVTKSQTWLKWLNTHTHKHIVLQPLPGVHTVAGSWWAGDRLSLSPALCTAALPAYVCVCWGWSVQRSRGGWVTLTSQQPGTSRDGEGAREHWWNVNPTLWTWPSGPHLRATVDAGREEEGNRLGSWVSGFRQRTENPLGSLGEVQEAGLCVNWGSKSSVQNKAQFVKKFSMVSKKH